MVFSTDLALERVSKIGSVGEVKTRFTDSIMNAVYFASSSGFSLSTNWPTSFWYGSSEIEILLLKAYSSSRRLSREYWTAQKAIAKINGREIESFMRSAGVYSWADWN